MNMRSRDLCHQKSHRETAAGLDPTPTPQKWGGRWGDGKAQKYMAILKPPKDYFRLQKQTVTMKQYRECGLQVPKGTPVFRLLQSQALALKTDQRQALISTAGTGADLVMVPHTCRSNIKQEAVVKCKSRLARSTPIFVCERGS